MFKVIFNFNFLILFLGCILASSKFSLKFELVNILQASRLVDTACLYLQCLLEPKI